MRILLEKLGVVRPVQNGALMGRHMRPWHPLFYKAVSVHIVETSSLRSNPSR
jgi:hypothetical protein